MKRLAPILRKSAKSGNINVSPLITKRLKGGVLEIFHYSNWLSKGDRVINMKVVSDCLIQNYSLAHFRRENFPQSWNWADFE